MNNKKLFQLAHSWEFTVVLNYLIQQKFFDYIGEGKTIDILKNHFGFVKEKLEAILDVLSCHELIQINKENILLSEYSRKFLLEKSELYIGSYINWRIQDFHNWQNNIDAVMKGKQKTVHGDFQYTKYTDDHKEALEGIVTACSRIYPIEEFSNKINENVKLSGTLLDLGCGTGLWGVTLKKLCEDLNLIFFDREIDFVQNTIKQKAEGVDNLKIIKGDMFIPNSLPKVDSVLVANVFMDWSDDSVVNMIKKIITECKPTNLLIHEFVNEENINYLADYNLFSQLETLGRIRDKQWWQEKLSHHFSTINFIKLDFGSTAIICRM